MFLPQLQSLRNHINPDYELQEMSMPCGDEIRLLLFARCDREKEDWYRRFVAASKGRVHEQDLQVPMAKFVDETDLQAAAAQQAVNLTLGGNKNAVRVATLFPIFFLSRYLLCRVCRLVAKWRKTRVQQLRMSAPIPIRQISCTMRHGIVGVHPMTWIPATKVSL